MNVAAFLWTENLVVANGRRWGWRWWTERATDSGVEKNKASPLDRSIARHVTLVLLHCQMVSNDLMVFRDGRLWIHSWIKADSQSRHFPHVFILPARGLNVLFDYVSLAGVVDPALVDFDPQWASRRAAAVRLAALLISTLEEPNLVEA